MRSREEILLKALKLGLRVEWSGYTIGMQDDGHCFCVAKNDKGEERFLGFPMDMPLFFKVAKELSEEDINVMAMNCALNEINRKDRRAQLAER